MTISWKPGDPDSLAQAIINNVQGDAQLVLDANVYTVRKLS